MTLKSQYTIPAHVMLQEVDDETLLFNAETGLFFSLNEIGATMWSVMNDHNSFESVLGDLLEMYEVEKFQLEEDLLAFGATLFEQKLLQISDNL